MAFDADDIAGCKIKHIRPDIDDLTDEFMTDRRWYLDRLLGPRVPIVNMEVGAADPALFGADHHVVNAHLRLRNVFDPKALLGFAFNNRFHSIF